MCARPSLTKTEGRQHNTEPQRTFCRWACLLKAQLNGMQHTIIIGCNDLSILTLRLPQLRTTLQGLASGQMSHKEIHWTCIDASLRSQQGNTFDVNLLETDALYDQYSPVAQHALHSVVTVWPERA